MAHATNSNPVYGQGPKGLRNLPFSQSFFFLTILKFHEASFPPPQIERNKPSSMVFTKIILPWSSWQKAKENKTKQKTRHALSLSDIKHARGHIKAFTKSHSKETYLICLNPAVSKITCLHNLFPEQSHVDIWEMSIQSNEHILKMKKLWSREGNLPQLTRSFPSWSSSALLLLLMDLSSVNIHLWVVFSCGQQGKFARKMTKI